MASPFPNVPSTLERQLELSSDRFKAFLHNLERGSLGDRSRREQRIRAYLREVQLWPNQFLYIHDVNTGRYYHKGLNRALGYDLNRLTPDFFVRNIHPGDLPQYFEISQALLRFVMEYADDLVPFESSCQVTYRMRRKNGGYVSVLRKSTPFLKNGDGEVEAYISRCTDISPVNAAQEVKWKIFGPRQDRFSDFLDEPDEEQLGNNLFTEREMDVLRLLRTGHTSAEIADELYISVNTVNTHRKSLMRKAEVDNTVELLFFAQEHGYL
jgi:DNA-binding CsgD family transcriptional regulator